ncbi:hypothetical protein EJ04DRAFT_495200 [Polyplosphaeria fusca]|uniref:Uncharacterized protein n=1 Tax=Polyplosphaeria fusca TaxID=682080 RepID=A0A9P4QT67_9PLEO|nr:hypothetical protein EJ04DRAFT_495200 [Polyplosphaeria fusca]
MASSVPFGDDLMPAFRTLSKFVEPHGKVLLLVALAFNTTIIPPQATTPAILLAGAYLLGSFKDLALPSDATTAVASLPSLLEPLAALQTVFKRLGRYFKIGLLISLACYLPIQYGNPLLFQPWIYCLLFATVAAVGTFAPTAKFYGPLRFGYFEYTDFFTQAFQLLTNTWLYVAVFLLFSPAVFPYGVLGLVGVILGAWVHVFRAYHKQLRIITDEASEEVSRAQYSLSTIQKDRNLVRDYEQHVLQAAATARQDAIHANAVKISDFFDCAAKAWAALDEVTQPANDTVNAAGRMIVEAQELEDIPDEDQEDVQARATYLRETAEKVKVEAEHALYKLKVAQQGVRASENAVKVDRQARAEAESNAAAAVKSAKEISTKVMDLLTTELQLAKKAAKVSRLTGQAVATATDGKMAKARELNASAKELAKTMETEESPAWVVVSAANKALHGWLGSNRKASQEPRYSDWEGSTEFITQAGPSRH